MAIREPFVVPDGWRLVMGGVCSETRRDIDYPRSWLGLSADDRCLLQAFLAERREEVQELHTDVAVGLCPGDEDTYETEWMRAYSFKVHPLRIDAVVGFGCGWRVLEMKPDAGYVALGQILCYLFFARLGLPELEPLEGMVVTNRVQGCIAPVFAAQGITVVEVADVVGW